MTRSDDPLGRRALFGTPPPATEDAVSGAGQHTQTEGPRSTGRRALFSSLSGPEPPSGPPSAATTTDGSPTAPGARGGRVVVECGSCRARTPLGLAGLAAQLIPSVWVPIRRLSCLMRCPSCRRLTWCRLDWKARVSL